MNKIFETGIATIIAFPLLACAQVELLALPSNIVVHVAEPVNLRIVARNSGISDVSGMFILNGRYDGLSISINKIGETEPHRFVNAKMLDAIKDDIMFQPVALKPEQEISEDYCILYNVRSGAYVFETPGEYEVCFRLRWRPQGRNYISSMARVIVKDWDKAHESRQLEALNLWKTREIASAFQDGAALDASLIERLRKLKDDYKGTVYGDFASKLLARHREP